MSFSNFLENALLAHALSTYTFYVGYGTASAGEDGASAAEPAGGTGYAREAYGAYTLTAVGLDAQEVTNDADITFDVASSGQGTITHVYFYDALTVGNFLGEVSFAELSLSDISMIAGSNINLAAGECKVTLD